MKVRPITRMLVAAGAAQTLAVSVFSFVRSLVEGRDGFTSQFVGGFAVYVLILALLVETEP